MGTCCLESLCCTSTSVHTSLPFSNISSSSNVWEPRKKHHHFPSDYQEVLVGLYDLLVCTENNLCGSCIWIMQIRTEWARHHPVVLWYKFTHALHWANDKICQKKSEMCTVNASKEDQTGTRSTNERTGYFHSEDDQLYQRERRSTPDYVPKANSNFIHIWCQGWYNQQYQ